MEAIGKGDGASQAIRKCDGLKSSCLASTFKVDALHQRDGLHQPYTQGQTTFSVGGRGGASGLETLTLRSLSFLPSIVADLLSTSRAQAIMRARSAGSTTIRPAA
jgi:hypothetical protein